MVFRSVSVRTSANHTPQEPHFPSEAVVTLCSRGKTPKAVIVHLLNEVNEISQYIKFMTQLISVSHLNSLNVSAEVKLKNYSEQTREQLISHLMLSLHLNIENRLR